METQVGITLTVDMPTPITGAYGPTAVVILGKWYGGSVLVERKLPERAGYPYPEGSWTGVPWSVGVDAPRQPAEPYTERIGPRIYWLYDARVRVRVVAAEGQPMPELMMSISDPLPGMRAQDTVVFKNLAANPANFLLKGGKYGVDVMGAGFGTVTLKKVFGDGSVAAVGASTTFAANGYAVVDLPPGVYQLTIATAAAVYVQIARIPND